MCERMNVRMPIKAEQVQRLNEDKAFDHSAAIRDLAYQPRSFKEGITAQLAEMKFSVAPGGVRALQPC
jgi:hypothetical protein